MTRIKAVVFDLDGVLIDAREWHFEALNRALSSFGHEISPGDHQAIFDGLSTRQKLERLSRERGLPRHLHGLVNELKQRYTKELISARCRPVVERELALSNLRAAGYKLAVASNSTRSSIELMLGKSNLRSHFEALVSNQDVRVGKPDPEIYLKAFALLKTTPAETLVVEDNAHGIAAARSAGAHLMVVDGVGDVTFENVMRHVRQVEAGTGREAPVRAHAQTGIPAVGGNRAGS